MSLPLQDHRAELRSVFAWSALSIFAGLMIYGLLHLHLFAQSMWDPIGAVRFERYSVIFWICAAILIFWRPRWLLPGAMAIALGWSVWWCGIWWGNPLAPLAVIFFLGSCWATGTSTAQRANPVMALLLGLSVWIFVLSIAVRFPVNYRLVYGIALAVPYGFAWPKLKDSVRSWRIPQVDRAEAAALAVLLFFLLAHWLVALKPEVGADGLAMHLAAPMAIAHDGRWAFDVTRFTWTFMPMGADWAYTAAFVLGGEGAAKLLDFAMLVVIALLIRRLAPRWLPPVKATLAAALFASTPLVQLVTGSLMVENVWAAIVLGGIVALIEGELIWAGVLLGSALAVKVGSSAYVFPALIMGTVLAFRKKKAREAALALALLIVFAAPTYLTAYLKTGNPLFPYLNQIFHAPGFDTKTAFEDIRYRQPLRWTTLFDATFHSHDFYEAQNGGLGFQYFLLLIPSVFLLKKRETRLAGLFGLVGAILTFRSQPNIRYLYPALPLLTIAFADVWPGSVLVGAAALNLWFLPSSSWYHKDFALSKWSQADAYLTQSAPQRKLIAILDRSAPGANAAFFGGDPIAGFFGRAYTDTWHSYSYWTELGSLAGGRELVAEYQKLDVKYVVAPLSGETIFLAGQELINRWLSAPIAKVDTFGLYTILKEPRPLEAVPVPPGSYDDTSVKIQYRGSWLHDRHFADASGGSITYSAVTGGSLRLIFRGSGVTYWFTRAFNRGVAQVLIDGEPRDDIDLYSANLRWQQKREYLNLGSGVHTIEIFVSGHANPKASGVFVDVDRLDVDP